MAKFLFPTGRKSYFMAVIPLSRIQRLAVGNRGGREACRWEEGAFCLPGDGALLRASPRSRAPAAVVRQRSEAERQRGRASA